ncbi:hypothetical protein PG989_000855 [Apiospora arundinis]
MGFSNFTRLAYTAAVIHVLGTISPHTVGRRGRMASLVMAISFLLSVDRPLRSSIFQVFVPLFTRLFVPTATMPASDADAQGVIRWITAHLLRLGNPLKGKTHIRLFSTEEGNQFGSEKFIPLRRLDALYLDEESVTGPLLRDMKTFLSPEKKRYYADNDYSYRRAYMLHGPSGTGKTSLVNALAGHFDLPLYSLDVCSISDDAGLHAILKSLPPQSIVLLEDIDIVSEVIQSRNAPESDHDDPSTTVSGLLEALDNFTSPTGGGHVIVMTATQIDKLDIGFDRPGRVDMEVYIGHMTKERAKAMFMGMMDHGGDKDGLEMFAGWFSEAIPENIITPAEMENYLISHRGDFEEAYRDVHTWVSIQSNQYWRERIPPTNPPSFGDGDDKGFVWGNGIEVVRQRSQWP